MSDLKVPLAAAASLVLLVVGIVAWTQPDATTGSTCSFSGPVAVTKAVEEEIRAARASAYPECFPTSRP